MLAIATIFFFFFVAHFQCCSHLLRISHYDKYFEFLISSIYISKRNKGNTNKDSNTKLRACVFGDVEWILGKATRKRYNLTWAYSRGTASLLNIEKGHSSYNLATEVV